MSRHLPALRPAKVLAALKRAGFYVHHTKGSHHILKHPDRPNLRVTVADHNADLKRKTLASIIDQAGYTVEDFLKLLSVPKSTASVFLCAPPKHDMPASTRSTQ